MVWSSEMSIPYVLTSPLCKTQDSLIWQFFFVINDVIDSMQHHHDAHDETDLLNDNDLMQLYFGDDVLIQYMRACGNLKTLLRKMPIVQPLNNI
jgi:hypothetical protein